MVHGMKTWWWLSFADPERPEGEQFLGAVVIDADGETPFHAHFAATALGLNPGGEMVSIQIPAEIVEANVPERFRRRLLSEAEVAEMGPYTKGSVDDLDRLVRGES